MEIENQTSYFEGSPRLIIGHKGVPGNAEKVLVDGRGQLHLWPGYPYKDLEPLRPLLPLVRALKIETLKTVNISALLENNDLRCIIDNGNKLRGLAPGHVWPKLRKFVGDFHPALMAQLGSGVLEDLGMSKLTDEALLGIRGTFVGLGVHSPRAELGLGWPRVEFASEDFGTMVASRTRPYSLANFPGLGGSVHFDSVKAIIGLDRATRDIPAKELSFKGVKDVVCEGTIWDIQAEIIYVSEEGPILPWILRDWSKRPKNWEERWVFSDNYLKKLRLLD